MQTRAQQREATRDRIIDAAAQAFSEHGFRAASTRDIAARAGVNQGLITYHFRTKDELWKASTDRMFERLGATLGAGLEALESDDPRTRAREAARVFVRYAAAHPELFRLMVEEGKHRGRRMRWIVDTHLKPLYERFMAGGIPPDTAGGDAALPHTYYVLVGAGSVIFAVAPECRRLTGLDPTTKKAIEAHADFVARLLVP